MAAVAPKTNKEHDLGTSALRWGTLYAGEVNLDGNLTVTGAVTTTVSQTLEVEDATIKVAKGNTAADSVDFGMYGVYNDGGVKYSILFRDNSDSGKWKIWSGFTNEPPAAGNVNIADGSVGTLCANLQTDAITGTTSDGHITITPDGTGNLHVVADTLRVGDSNANAVITTNGTGDLTLSTNGGTNSGVITIADGADGNIAITPNGTGEVDISKVDIDGGTIDGATIATSDVTVGAGKTLDVSAGTLTTSAAQKAAIVAGVGADVDIGDNDLRAQTLTADSLTATRVVFAGANGVLTDDSDLTFSGDTLTATKIGAFTAAGAIDFDSQNMTNVDIDSGTIDGATIATSDITVGAGKTLNVSAGTLQVGGVTVSSTAAELNLVDGSEAGNVVNSKAVIYGGSGEVNATTLQIGGTSITATAAEINKLDDVTADTTDLNRLDVSAEGTTEASHVVTTDSSNVLNHGGASNFNGTVTVGNNATLSLSSGSDLDIVAGDLNVQNGDIEVSGDVDIAGDLTVTGAAIVKFSDPLLQFNNGGDDLGNSRDLGFWGTKASDQYRGLIYDGSDSVWKLFESTSAPTNNFLSATPSGFSALKAGSIQQSVQTLTETATSGAEAPIILVNNGSGSDLTVTIHADLERAGQVVTIKDIAGNGASNTIKVDATSQIQVGSSILSGSAVTAITSNYGVLRLVYNGSSWFEV